MADLLIVDDDPDVSEIFQELLAVEGHTVRVAYDGLQGLAALDERLPDVVLLDVEMPHLNGPAMAYRMFLHDAGFEHIPIILLSGRMDLRQVAAAVGTRYYLAKPYSFPKVLQLIALALEEKAAPLPRVHELAASWA
jgi:CheY-like chemotaxis protein